MANFASDLNIINGLYDKPIGRSKLLQDTDDHIRREGLCLQKDSGWVKREGGAEGINENPTMVWYQPTLDTNISPSQEEEECTVHHK